MSPVSWGPALRSIVQRVESSDVSELEIRVQGLVVRLRREVAAAPAAPERPDEEADASGLHTLRCPLTGIWYDSPAPGSAPFVAVGDSVDVGSVVGLIETMKVFNEVAADVAGVVRETLVARGDLVNQNAALIRIEPRPEASTHEPSALG